MLMSLLLCHVPFPVRLSRFPMSPSLMMSPFRPCPSSLQGPPRPGNCSDPSHPPCHIRDPLQPSCCDRSCYPSPCCFSCSSRLCSCCSSCRSCCCPCCCCRCPCCCRCRLCWTCYWWTCSCWTCSCWICRCSPRSCLCYPVVIYYPRWQPTPMLSLKIKTPGCATQSDRLPVQCSKCFCSEGSFSLSFSGLATLIPPTSIRGKPGKLVYLEMHNFNQYLFCLDLCIL